MDDRFVALQEALLGRYSLERELGRGGMGTVFLARYYGPTRWNQFNWEFINSMARWAHLVFWTGTSLQVLHPPFRLRANGWIARRQQAFWNSSSGAARFRRAAMFLPKGRVAEHTLHRPTELMLDVAIEDLWDALPRTERRRLQDVPRLASELRRRASEARDALRRLDASPLAITDEVEAITDRLRAQERSAIGALERLRIGLIELTSEGAMPTDFSQIFADAATLQAELLTELGADRKVIAKVVSQRHLRTGSSPTPTPSPA